MIKLGCNDSLPKGWEWAKANDVMDVRDGTHDSPKAQATGIPLVTSKNLVNGKIDYSTCTYISAEDHESISKRSAVDDGDILYAMIGTIGNPVIVKKDFDFSIKNVALFKFTKTDLSNRYIYHYLNSGLAKQQFESNSRGGTQKFVSLGNIRELMIPLPPLEEQKRIAAILDKADAIRRKRQQAIDLADDFLRSVFLDMFGDPVTNPKGFPASKLGDLCEDLFLGLTSKVDYVDGGEGYPLVRAKDINTGELSFEDVKYISEDQHRKLTKNHLTRKGDLLVSKSGTLGTCAIVRTDREFSTYESIFTVRPDNSRLDLYYLIHLLQNKGFKEKLIGKKVGGTVAHLNLKMFRDFEIGLPPISLQHLFSKTISKIEVKLEKYRASVDKAEFLFNSLSHKSFSGELQLCLKSIRFNCI